MDGGGSLPSIFLSDVEGLDRAHFVSFPHAEPGVRKFKLSVVMDLEHLFLINNF